MLRMQPVWLQPLAIAFHTLASAMTLVKLPKPAHQLLASKPLHTAFFTWRSLPRSFLSTTHLESTYCLAVSAQVALPFSPPPSTPKPRGTSYQLFVTHLSLRPTPTKIVSFFG